MRHWRAVAAAAILGAALAGMPAQAQGKNPTCSTTSLTSVTGTVSTSPSGRGFVLRSRKNGNFTVDARNARVQQYGKFTSFGAVKRGLVVNAYGKVSGSRIKANLVCICPASPGTTSRTAGYRGRPSGMK